MKRIEVFPTDAGWTHWSRPTDAAAVLGTVKARPGTLGGWRLGGATAGLDSPCARRVRSAVGTGRKPAARSNKEAFGQLWDYGREGWARRFFDNWRASLKWQRLRPYERFADMIDRHWDGIAAYCKPENKVSLGFVEGLNNKIRVFQRRAYGLRDEEYLRLKVLTCMLPAL